jgi:hypothetical protein
LVPLAGSEAAAGQGLGEGSAVADPTGLGVTVGLLGGAAKLPKAGVLLSRRGTEWGELHESSKTKTKLKVPTMQNQPPYRSKRFMIYILLEAFLAGMLLVVIVWWTMFSGRPGGERQVDPSDTGRAPDPAQEGDEGVKPPSRLPKS